MIIKLIPFFAFTLSLALLVGLVCILAEVGIIATILITLKSVLVPLYALLVNPFEDDR